jgi:hypothetical protein
VRDYFRPIFSAPGVSSLIIGTINHEHLRENALAANEVCSGFQELEDSVPPASRWRFGFDSPARCWRHVLALS